MTIVLTHEFNSPCIICNCTPLDETKELKQPLEMFHAQGVSVNWNEDCNICQICARVMAEMLGLIDPKDYDRLKARHNDLREKHDELQEKFQAQRERINDILAGRKAAKAQQEAAA